MANKQKKSIFKKGSDLVSDAHDGAKITGNVIDRVIVRPFNAAVGLSWWGAKKLATNFNDTAAVACVAVVPATFVVMAGIAPIAIVVPSVIVGSALIGRLDRQVHKAVYKKN